MTPITYEDVYIHKTLHAERCLIALGWLQPIELNNAGCEISLSTDHFFSHANAYVYFHICQCADQGITPDVPDCCREAGDVGIVIYEDDLFDLINKADVIDGSTRLYAGSVRDAYHRRETAVNAFRQYRHVIKGYAGV